MIKALDPTESQIQIALVEWAWLKHKVTLKCNPNELVGRLGKGPTFFWKKMGVRVGWSDLEMMEPRGRYHGFFIELKRKGEKPRNEQLFWLDYLAKRGYYTCWSDNFDDACEKVENYLKLT